jgi:hypothetical protein
MFPDFIPLENRGMSIITALTFFFYTVGFGYFYSTIKREFKRINTELIRHETKLDKYQGDISDMKTNIALTLQSITRIERTLDKIK